MPLHRRWKNLTARGLRWSRAARSQSSLRAGAGPRPGRCGDLEPWGLLYRFGFLDGLHAFLESLHDDPGRCVVRALSYEHVRNRRGRSGGTQLRTRSKFDQCHRAVREPARPSAQMKQIIPFRARDRVPKWDYPLHLEARRARACFCASGRSSIPRVSNAQSGDNTAKTINQGELWVIAYISGPRSAG